MLPFDINAQQAGLSLEISTGWLKELRLSELEPKTFLNIRIIFVHED
jgi:hypothetical protein